MTTLGNSYSDHSQNFQAHFVGTLSIWTQHFTKALIMLELLGFACLSVQLTCDSLSALLIGTPSTVPGTQRYLNTE